MSTTGYKCDNVKCKHLPEYTYNIIGKEYFIKLDTICASICLGGHIDRYCRDCIDDIYKIIKLKLDTNLWAFK